MTRTPDTSADASQWAQCHCCGRTYPVAKLATFHDHPGDHICATCIRWLYAQARLSTRISRRFPLRSLIRAWTARPQE